MVMCILALILNGCAITQPKAFCSYVGEPGFKELHCGPGATITNDGKLGINVLVGPRKIEGLDTDTKAEIQIWYNSKWFNFYGEQGE